MISIYPQINKFVNCFEPLLPKVYYNPLMEVVVMIPKRSMSAEEVAEFVRIEKTINGWIGTKEGRLTYYSKDNHQHFTGVVKPHTGTIVWYVGLMCEVPNVV
jgi:hypothetical protein